MHIIRTIARLISLLLLAMSTLAVQAQASTCHFSSTLESLVVYHAPLTQATQIKDTLPGGTPYTVLWRSGDHYFIAVDHAYGGWVDRSSGTLSGACDSIPVDATPLVDYPTICVFEAQQQVAAFADATLTTPSPFGVVPAFHPYPIITRTDTAYEILFDHAASAWVTASSGQMYGTNCSFDHQAAYAGTNARLWSLPNARTGSILTTLAPGSVVSLTGTPVSGPIRIDTDHVDLWYPVSQGNLSGWVWAERLIFPAPAPHPTLAVTLPNARLWSLPDAHTGQLLIHLAEGLSLPVIAGPVRGPVRFDTADRGDWYQVRLPSTGNTGWVWAERLSFE